MAEALPNIKNNTTNVENAIVTTQVADISIDGDRFKTIRYSDAKDIIDDRYQIIANKPIPALDTTFSKAFTVVDTHNKSSDGLYCLVLDKKYPIRLTAINKLNGLTQPGFTNVISFQVISFSPYQGKSFCVLLEKPRGVTFTEYITKNGAISEQTVINVVIPQINEILGFLERNKIVHGKIHPSKIYIDAQGKVIVGECISEPCGYSQEMLYETLDRAVCLPSGKGEGTNFVDFFALGVMAAYLIRGHDPIRKIQEYELLEKRFADGTYTIITRGLDLSLHTLDLLRGVLDSKKSKEISYEHIKEWSKGRNFNLLPPTVSVEASRPISFVGKKFINRQHLVHAFHKHWDEAKEFVKDNTLIRWVERSMQDSDLTDRLSIMSARAVGETSETFSREDELLINVILLLDPEGPMRFREFAAHIDAIGTTLAYAYATDNKSYMERIKDIFYHDMTSIWKNDFFPINNEYFADRIYDLQVATEMFLRREQGFGMNRCLYELNKSLPCQSKKVLDYLVFDISGLLKRLELDDTINDKILDEHMWAFLSSRLELPKSIKLTSLSRFPEYANDQYIQTLSILAHAQDVSKIWDFPKLSEKMSISLKQIISEFHGKTIKNEITKKIDRVKSKGNLAFLFKIMTDQKYIVRDTVGFVKANKKYKKNAFQIIMLNNRRVLNNIAYRNGLQFAVFLSFLIVSLVALLMIMKYLT